MAVSVTSKSTITKDAQRDWKLSNGPRLAIVEITMSDVSADYSSGVDLDAVKGQVGFSHLLGVIPLSVRTSANALRFCTPLWDMNTKKLRIFLTGAVSDFMAETATDGTDIADGDIVQAIFIGV